MSNTKLVNNYLPKRMNIILYTKTNQSVRKVYTPQMSIPNSNSRFVNFNPLVKINREMIHREYKINTKENKSLSEDVLDVFLNKATFNDFLNKILIKTGTKELSIKDSCDNKVIDNNIKVTLDVLFKMGNVLQIDGKPYTIYKYSWLNGDWLIYSDDIKETNDQQEYYYNYNRRNYNDTFTEKKVTRDAFNELSQEIPDCLKGITEGTSLLVTGDKKIVEEKLQPNEKENKLTIQDQTKIENFFNVNNNDLFNLSENKDFLPYNLNYNIPSFLKDPISVSLFYLEYNFKKEFANYSSLEKTFNKLDAKKQELESLVKTIFKNTGIPVDSNSKTKTKINKYITNTAVLNENKEKLNKLFNDYTNKSKSLNKTCKENIYRELHIIFYDITKNDYANTNTNIRDIKKYIDCIGYIPNSGYYSPQSELIHSEINKQFKELISMIDEKIKYNNAKLQQSNYNENNLDALEKLLSSEKDVKKYIDVKTKYLKICRETLEMIQQKIVMENDYLLLFIAFYKQLYTCKKKELSNTYQLSSDQKWLLTMVNQIILFDLIIYNTIYNSPDYKESIDNTTKIIANYIEKIKTFQTIRLNIKDETINMSKDSSTLSSFKSIIYYANYVINMKFWDDFSRKTTELKNNFSTIVSKTIQNYYKLNESFSHASEYESKLKTMKHTCFDLINMYSRMNMICFLRNYICAKYNTSFNNYLQKTLNTNPNTKNKYYLDISVIISFLDISIKKYDESLLDAAYLNYKDSVKMLTPSISMDSIEKICNNIVTEDDEKINIVFLKKKEFDFIKEHFKTTEFDSLFTTQNINIVAYKELSLNVAIENGINWYLCNNGKVFNDEFPIVLGDENTQFIQDKYKINICFIKNEPTQNTLVKTQPGTYENTLFIFQDDANFYNILHNNEVVLLPSNTTLFNNIPTISQGGSQREQIESIMNQSVLNNLLEKPNEKNKMKQLNTLAYIVPIKLELYEGTEIPLNKKVALNCEDNYNNILKSWKLLFPIKEEKKSRRYQQMDSYSF